MNATTTAAAQHPALIAEWRAANRYIAEHGVPADDRKWDDLNERLVAALGIDGVEALTM